VLRHAGAARFSDVAAGPLLLAGLGGGMVTSPNVTLTLESVPVRMAGAAGGALQTAQRIGSAIGTALLVSVFYRVLNGSGHAWPTAVSDTLLCACGLMLLALLLAIGELWHRRSHRRDRPAPTPEPQYQHLHLS
jgi:MFS family permease